MTMIFFVEAFQKVKFASRDLKPAMAAGLPGMTRHTNIPCGRKNSMLCFFHLIQFEKIIEPCRCSAHGDQLCRQHLCKGQPIWKRKGELWSFFWQVQSIIRREHPSKKGHQKRTKLDLSWWALSQSHPKMVINHPSRWSLYKSLAFCVDHSNRQTGTANVLPKRRPR